MAPPRADLHIRVPDDLHALLVAGADAMGISLNAYCIILLRQGAERGT